MLSAETIMRGFHVDKAYCSVNDLEPHCRIVVENYIDLVVIYIPLFLWCSVEQYNYTIHGSLMIFVA